MSIHTLHIHPLVTHMQRFSLHDGPGIRTTVFLKGCPLRCPWCCNPEGIRPGVELAFQKHLCLGMEVCGRCAAACPHGCFQRMEESAAQSLGLPAALNRQHCDLCMACATVCPTGALAQVGRAITAEQIMNFCRQDAEAYALSGGGITLSGGEPLARPGLAAAVLRLARAENIHSALETCGWFDMDSPETREALACLDLCIINLKHSDSGPHQQHTGVDIQRIHCNLRRLALEFPRLPVHARVTVIPGFNAEEDVLRRLAQLAASSPTVEKLELIPCHTFGVSKYGHLGRPLLWGPTPHCSPARLAHWREMFQNCLQLAPEAEVAYVART